MIPMLHGLVFASDAELLALAGAFLLAVALLALIADRRQLRREDFDSVSPFGWTTISVLCLIAAAGLLSIAIPAVFAS